MRVKARLHHGCAAQRALPLCTHLNASLSPLCAPNLHTSTPYSLKPTAHARKHLAADRVLEAVVGELGLELGHHGGADLVFQVVFFKFIALCLAAVASNWRYLRFHRAPAKVRVW